MTNWTLFVRKTLSVFALAFLLVPLLTIKGGIPAMVYAFGLVLLHIAILGVYFYKVRFGELDPDRRSLAARVIGLVLTTYLLMVTSGFSEDDSVALVTAKMFGVSVVHMVMLLLLMVRVELPVPREPAEARAA